MIFFRDRGNPDDDAVTDLSATEFPAHVIWVDMFNPTPDEVQFIERLTSLHLPNHEDLKEIESSSRLYTESGALFMSSPLVANAGTSSPEVSPVGFILTRKVLVTIRYAEFSSFATFVQTLAKDDVCHYSSVGAVAGLLDAIIDRMADVLENVGEDLAVLSRRTFRGDHLSATKSRGTSRENADMRVILRRIGRAGDLLSTIRDSLLGVSRMIGYVGGLAEEWTPTDVKPYIKSLREDAVSLNDYVGHLNNKVQLLLDATLGLINIEQNNIFRILTIVSVVGIPPTLVASMYGMNFKFMPELDWAWGYPWGLGLIAISAIIPLVWFKLRGWS
ncbi:MAG: magnesium transporter CorA family protein [Parvibaculum sp.]|nr:magnesium transporter CorA family protein [Parvibaculum sp.]